MTHARVAQSPAPAPASVMTVPASAYASVRYESSGDDDERSCETLSAERRDDEPKTGKSARRAAASVSLAGASHRLTYISSTLETCSGGTTNAETAASAPAPARVARPPGTKRAIFVMQTNANATTPNKAPAT